MKRLCFKFAASRELKLGFGVLKWPLPWKRLQNLQRIVTRLFIPFLWLSILFPEMSPRKVLFWNPKSFHGPLWRENGHRFKTWCNEEASFQIFLKAKTQDKVKGSEETIVQKLLNVTSKFAVNMYKALYSFGFQYYFLICHHKKPILESKIVPRSTLKRNCSPILDME